MILPPHVGGRQREIVGMVFADPDEVDPDLVGEDALLDKVPDRLRVGQRAAFFVAGDVAEGVEPEGEWKRFRWCCGHVSSISHCESGYGTAQI